MTIDWTKPVTLRDGTPYRVLCTDAPGDFPVVGYFLNSEGEKFICSHTIEGTDFLDKTRSKLDLIQAKTKREGWVNVYSDGTTSSFVYETEEEANLKARVQARVACVRIEWEE